MGTLDIHFDGLPAWFTGAPPHGYYWGLILAWAAFYYLSCAPNRRVLESDSPDPNFWRGFYQFFAIVVVPPLALHALTGKFEELYAIGAAALYFVGRGLARVLTIAAPDSDWEIHFRRWAQTLRDGEIRHFFRLMSQHWRLGFALFCLVALSGYMLIAWTAWSIATETPAAAMREDRTLLEISGWLLSGIAIWTFAITLFVSWRTLGTRNITFPVRYSFLANSIHIFLCSLWAAAYPWAFFGSDLENVPLFVRIVIIVVGALIIYSFFVVAPAAEWRARFRLEREHHLLTLARILRRIAYATEFNPPDVAPLNAYRQRSLKSATVALENVLREIVQFSPFRAFVLVNHDEATRALYRNFATATPSNPYQAAVIRWLREEAAASKSRGWRDKRLLSALDIRNPFLMKMLEPNLRRELAHGDYRYRMMYWICLLLEKAEPENGPYLNPLAREALDDIEVLRTRNDQRSAVLATAGAGAVTLGGLIAALGHEAAEVMGRIVVGASGDFVAGVDEFFQGLLRLFGS